MAVPIGVTHVRAYAAAERANQIGNDASRSPIAATNDIAAARRRYRST